MFSFLNDLSINAEGVVILENLGIIKQLLGVNRELKYYEITKIRVPKDFEKKPIAGSRSLVDHLRKSKGDDKILLLDFIANRLENRPSAVEDIIRKEEKDKGMEIAIGKNYSILLLEAYLTKSPCLSFTIHKDHCVDFINCEYVTLTKDLGLTSKSVRLENIYSDESFTIHRSYLSELKKRIIFSKTKWIPYEKPIWNSDTRRTLDLHRFPQSTSGNREKKEELMEIGTIVAEINGWKFDEIITKKNKNSGQFRQIFKSMNRGKSSYLSIDFENAHGRFELHDFRGYHLGEIAFEDGRSTGPQDPTGNHNIIVK